MAAKKDKPRFPALDNRRARYEFEFVDTYEAGLVLQGTEVKALRAGTANLSDAYCYFRQGELWVRNLFIGEYTHGTYANHEAKRPRKLLLKRRELAKLEKRVREKGLTIVPVRVYMSDRGLVKMQVALARGKKVHDKRDSLKKKDERRALDRAKTARL